jgi:tRNA A37 threonylcarbamoyladenosine biosynthesis protein TsaE
LDLYRLSGAEDALAFGIDDYIAAPGPGAISLIEWPQRLEGLASGFPVVSVELSMPDPCHRAIRFTSGPLPLD